VTRLKRSQHWRRTMAIAKGVGEDEQLRRFAAGNLLGSPDEVIAQIRSFEQRTGVEHMGVVMLGETTDELVGDMELFAQEVMPAFA
jgi:alkanesulfonate monooxygenase SsuD/methylene tetrahydromethanopterin reductase-like flavin-dependent oxidoreductase (luciferase family)